MEEAEERTMIKTFKAVANEIAESIYIYGIYILLYNAFVLKGRRRKGGKMFEIAKVFVGGKVTLPKKARDRMNIDVGDYVAIEFEKMELVKSKSGDNGGINVDK